jgi:hypothetical protein
VVGIRCQGTPTLHTECPLRSHFFAGFQRRATPQKPGQAKEGTVRGGSERLSSQISPSVHRSGVKEDHTASYFSHNNAEANRVREQLASDCLEMLIQWLRDGGNVGIHGGDRIHPYPT